MLHDLALIQSDVSGLYNVYASHMGDMRVSVDKQLGEETGLRRGGGKALEHMSHRQSCPDPDRLITDCAHDLAQSKSTLPNPF